jgi:ABC-2 type transport system ATP-binding protein
MVAILEAIGLEKYFNGFAAVKGVSFSIEQGEIFSLLGPNGAGKTTTISMLSTLFPPTRGDATIAGHSITKDALAVRHAIGVVPQDLALYEDLTARENLRFWGRMYGLGGNDLQQRVDGVLAQIGLSDRANDRVRTYSGGMKRRVNIGIGLLHRPRLLFMDEPTVGIDPQSRRAILDTVLGLNRQGMSVLYTTHYMEEAQELSHRVGIMDHGQMIALGTVKELTRQVGERETLRLHLADGVDTARLAETMQTVPGVVQASANDHDVVVVLPDADEALAPIVTLANEAGAKIRSLDIEEPNLEAVFLHLTGRALRD